MQLPAFTTDAKRVSATLKGDVVNNNMRLNIYGRRVMLTCQVAGFKFYVAVVVAALALFFFKQFLRLSLLGRKPGQM